MNENQKAKTKQATNKNRSPRQLKINRNNILDKIKSKQKTNIKLKTNNIKQN